MKLVEVIPGEKTSSEITELTQEYVQISKTSKQFFVEKDVPGFIINRTFHSNGPRSMFCQR